MKKISFKEKFELENMESAIQALEVELKVATEANNYAEMANLQNEIEKSYSRWEELSKKIRI